MAPQREAQVNLIHTSTPRVQDTADLGLVLALWHELTTEWGSGKADPVRSAMPLLATKGSLHVRLAGNVQYAYSFDVVCRLASSRIDTMQASDAFFADKNNRRWFKKLPKHARSFQNRLAHFVELTKDSFEYWSSLSDGERTDAFAAARKLLEADIESGNTIVAVLPQRHAPARMALGKKIDAQGAIEALVEQIHSTPFQAQYRKRLISTPVTGWDQRLRTYFWPSPKTGYAETSAQLARMLSTAKELALALNDGAAWNDAQRAQAVKLALEIFTWGGVPQAPETVTADNVQQVFRDALNNNGDSKALINSGWPKVAAFATAHLEDDPSGRPQVIYDSRVATAVISGLDSVLEKDISPGTVFPGIGTVPGRGGSRPRQTSRPWDNGYQKWNAQVSGSELVRAMRDVLNTPENKDRYPQMPLPDGTKGKWTTRGVEMVLFMDGY